MKKFNLELFNLALNFTTEKVSSETEGFAFLERLIEKFGDSSIAIKRTEKSFEILLLSGNILTFVQTNEINSVVIVTIRSVFSEISIDE
jgi:hypothetical protein